MPLVSCLHLTLARPGAERIYFFSQLAIEMNEPEEGVAPTDSRNRPDQRMMEEGKWDEANRLKFLLEEKQRAARRQREAEAEKLKAQGEGQTCGFFNVLVEGKFCLCVCVCVCVCVMKMYVLYHLPVLSSSFFIFLA